MEEQRGGGVRMSVEIDGRLRWKFGDWVSRVHRFGVNCPAYFTFRSDDNGGVSFGAVKYELHSSCHVQI